MAEPKQIYENSKLETELELKVLSIIQEAQLIPSDKLTKEDLFTLNYSKAKDYTKKIQQIIVELI